MSSLYIILIIISYIVMMKFFKDKNTDILSIVFGLISIVLMFVTELNKWAVIQTPTFINYLLISILVVCALKSLYRVVNTIEPDKNYICFLGSFLVASINYKYLSMFVLIYITSNIYIKRKEAITSIDTKMTLLLIFVFLSLAKIESEILNTGLIIFLIFIQLCFVLRSMSVWDKVLLFLMSVFTCYQHNYSIYESTLMFIIPTILIVVDNIHIPFLTKIKNDIYNISIVERAYIKLKISIKNNYIINYNEQPFTESLPRRRVVNFIDKRSDSILIAIFSLVFVTLIILTSWGV